MSSQHLEFKELKGNTAPSTVAGKKIAKANFNKFLVITGNDALEDMTEEKLCDPSLLRKYATYLVEHYVTKEDKPLMCDSAKQYISGAFNTIRDRHPGSESYRAGIIHDWYSKMRQDLDAEITLRCIEVGEEVASKSFPVGRDVLNDISSFYLRENSVESMYHRFEFCLQFASGGGRTGESALVSTNGCYWDPILQAFTLNWNQKKLRRQDICNYVNDWNHFEIDFYHCFAGYLIVKGGTLKNSREVESHASNFLLPHLSSLKGSNAAAKLTRAIQELHGKVKNVPSNIDGTSLRSGAIQTMAAHSTTTLFHVAVRSGHQQDLSRDCRAFEYTWCTPSATLVGGMALAGYSNSGQRCYTARLAFYNDMSKEEQTALTNMMGLLFDSDLNYGTAKDSLYHCLLATVLMHLESMVSDYSMNNIMVQEIVKTARQFKFVYRDLIAFGSIVRKDFLQRNLAHVPVTSSIPEVRVSFASFSV